MGPVAESPRWNEDGSTRPSGCWYGQFERVHAVPNLQGIEATLCGTREGWENEQLGLVHAAPYRHCVWDDVCRLEAGGAGEEYVLGFSRSAEGAII